MQTQIFEQLGARNRLQRRQAHLLSLRHERILLFLSLAHIRSDGVESGNERALILEEFLLLEGLLGSVDVVGARQALLQDADHGDEHLRRHIRIEVDELAAVHVCLLLEDEGDELLDLLVVREPLFFIHVLALAAQVETLLRRAGFAGLSAAQVRRAVLVFGVVDAQGRLVLVADGDVAEDEADVFS